MGCGVVDVVSCVDHVVLIVVVVVTCCCCVHAINGDVLVPRMKILLCVDMLAECYCCYGVVVVVLLCC